MEVIKRDGRRVSFDKEKIRVAVKKAFNEVEQRDNIEIPDVDNTIGKIVNEVCECLHMGNGKVVKIETIQDTVEEVLMSYRFDVAKAYITYRYEHAMMRDKYKDFMDSVKEKIMATNIQNQNANVDEASFGGRKGEAANTLLKQFALDYCMSDMARQNHLNNEIYIHDLDSYSVGMHNCLTIPFDNLLANGFNTRQTDVRPAQSVSTAFQLLAVIFQLQSLQQFGGVSSGHLDWTMVPYVRKSFTKHLSDGLAWCENKSSYKVRRFSKWIKNNPDYPDSTIHFDDEDFKTKHPVAWEYAIEMTTKEVYQAVEGMYHNLNTLQSRSGNQLPFTSINYGTCTLPEGRLITKALLDVSIKGIGKLHKTSVFPCGIFQCMKGINRKQGDPNYDLFRLALKSTSLRLYPNYANVDWSGNAGYDINDPRTYFSTMGKVFVAHVKFCEPKQKGCAIYIVDPQEMAA